MDKAFNEAAFLSLSKENQDRVECIYHIAYMLRTHEAPRLTPAEFDALYEKPVRELRAITDYIGVLPDVSREPR